MVWKFKGTVELIENGNILQSDIGDVLFTKYGISGPRHSPNFKKSNDLLNQNRDIWVKSDYS